MRLFPHFQQRADRAWRSGSPLFAKSRKKICTAANKPKRLILKPYSRHILTSLPRHSPRFAFLQKLLLLKKNLKRKLLIFCLFKTATYVFISVRLKIGTMSAEHYSTKSTSAFNLK
jgi:hypothetical protein